MFITLSVMPLKLFWRYVGKDVTFCLCVAYFNLVVTII